jgi:brefeldin A-inhibited guanine nucleotide-exchange protein
MQAYIEQVKGKYAETKNKLEEAKLQYQVEKDKIDQELKSLEIEIKKGELNVKRTEVAKGGKDFPRIMAVDKPRVYSLQKLVEVADYNMKSRSRLSWAKIWELMANHFVVIGCHENPMVSMFAIDALRQLSFKFLEKAELADFNFQRLFLQPFLLIMENPNSLPDTREIILQCVDNMIRSLSSNIRSGWKIFFAILSLSANDTSEKNCRLGLSVLQNLVDCHLDDFCPVLSLDRSVNDSRDGKIRDQFSSAEAKEQSMVAENFIGLCGASLAFVVSKKELPMALSMRALCHVACYADQIAEGKILPPVCNVQTIDKSIPGYTYEGLPVGEQCQMSLWRPIFDGLAGGICSIVSCTAGGVGCFIQRGSVITLRSILLRYGTLFTPNQWKAILNQSIFPAIEIAAKNDSSPVINIISESPSVSNLDFLTEPLPLPPPVDDEGLLEFAALWKIDDSHNTAKRVMGHAELLVEASFVDLKHGGTGNLSKAFTLLNKSPIKKNIEEPFPDSWVATTAPIALGMFTDIFCLIMTHYESSVAKDLWAVTAGLMKNWAVGSPCGFKASESKVAWSPSEALVRIGCKEISHLSKTVFTLFPNMKKHEVAAWLGFLCQNLAETLALNVELESELHGDMLSEISEMEIRLAQEQASQTIQETIDKETKSVVCETPYGKGTVIGSRIDEYDGVSVDISVVKLDSGATMYGLLQRDTGVDNQNSSKINDESDSSTEEGKSTLVYVMFIHNGASYTRVTVLCSATSFEL